MYVPVKSKDGKQLMPTSPSVARHLIKSSKATPYFSNGIFCIRLNYESTEYTQDIVVGVDPGSKKEGFTVKSESHTYLNIQADAHNKIDDKLSKRKDLRCSRRSRNRPNRKQRFNRQTNKKRIPASTRTRWDWKFRILDWLSKLYPITHVCVEDIKAVTKQYQRRWNKSFSPLQQGKNWFYDQIRKRWELFLLEGWQTKEIRDRLGLKKSSNKMSETFEAHCVDSWCLAYHTIGGSDVPDNTNIFCISPIPISRRKLHYEQPSKGGIRKRYGGTVLIDEIIKNTLVKHVNYGLCRIGGVNYKGYFSVYNIETKKIITGNTARSKFKPLTKMNFYYRWA